MSKKKAKLPLSKTHPKLAKEAHGWDPMVVTFGSVKRLKWKCTKGHIYVATVNSRTSNKTGCPICSNKIVLKGFNDLATTHPKIAREANGWDPTKVISGSEKKFEWKCPKGHVYSSALASRTQKKRKPTGCPICANLKILIGFNDLATTHPQLMKEASGWNPTDFVAGSGKKVEWICQKGHKWIIAINSRTGQKKTGCPYCSNQKLLVGFNDLATTHPDVAQQAFGWDPSQVIAGTTKKRKWKCNKNHIWEVGVGTRTDSRRRGCPVCANLKIQIGVNDLATTHPDLAKEAYGWDPRNVVAGSNKKMKWKCSKGHIFEASPNTRSGRGSGCGFCSNHLLLSGFNDLQTRYPHIASQASGWNPKLVMPGSVSKRRWSCEQGHSYEAAPVARTGGNTGCPVCANLKVLEGVNDLATTHPDLAKEAYGWDPRTIVAGSEKKLSWKCPLGHEYIAMPGTRTKLNGSKCPVCANQKLLTGFNDLATTHPELAKEADGWDPSKIIAGTNRILKWKCLNGHKYKTTGSHRIGDKPTGCPTCANSGFDPNDDAYLYFLQHDEWQMFQIGITNSPSDRVAKHKKTGWEMIEIRGPMDGHLTQQWETSILRMLKAKGADLANSKIAGKFDGYSEAWSKSTFSVKSIMELMRLTEEFEEEKQGHRR